jgi:hypothetical protein
MLVIMSLPSKSEENYSRRGVGYKGETALEDLSIVSVVLEKGTASERQPQVSWACADHIVFRNLDVDRTEDFEDKNFIQYCIILYRGY